MSHYVRDLLERALATFIQAFLTVFAGSAFMATALSDGVLDVGLLKRAAVSAVAAGGVAIVAVGKGIAARRVGDPNTAALTRKPGQPANPGATA